MAGRPPLLGEAIGLEGTLDVAHSLPAQNHLRLHNQQWVTPTTNRRFGRIKKRLRRCAGEDPTRTA